MMVAAPITMVIGIDPGRARDVGLSIVLVVAIPAAVIVLGLVIVPHGAGVPA